MHKADGVATVMPYCICAEDVYVCLPHAVPSAVHSAACTVSYSLHHSMSECSEKRIDRRGKGPVEWVSHRKH